MGEDSRNEKIIRRVKGLLALSENNSNDEEAQSSFIMAQKLMAKYNISTTEIETKNTSNNIDEGQATVYKKLFWWERELARIISGNFRVKYYYNNRILENEKKAKRAIVFMGFEEDIALAKEMYLLAYEVLVFYSKRYVDNWYQEENAMRMHRVTNILKNSYMRGFLYGLESKFEEQVEQLREENALMVLVPKEVEDKYEEMFEGKKGINLNIPDIEETEAFNIGYSEGNKVDYTKRTINDEILY